VAVVAEEPRVRVRVADVVRDEVQRVRRVLPIRDELGDVVVDGDVGILVDHPADGIQIPTVLRIERECREVETLPGSDHEEVAHPRIFVDTPDGRTREDETVVDAALKALLHRRVLRVDQRDLPVRVDPEDRRVGVLGRLVVDADRLAPPQNGLGAPVQPYPGLQTTVLPGRLGP
jgi:hypothetical protein